MKEEDRCDHDEDETDDTQFRGVGQKGIDVLCNGVVRGGHDVGEDKGFDLFVLFAEVWKTDDNRKTDEQERNDGEDRVEAQTRGIVGNIGIVKAFEVAVDGFDESFGFMSHAVILA
ncbi:hypothetical protein HCR_09750 [Hydrogenimonas cancrithermarum]|uniref:Uncharacterized protein n=1 Tax=Hydrogenimonas cancrithermarum TaxID=2993563 RepID=A0ABN6WUM9_9BACT|nr:hypothetical protein HCR_09750 [Hydrogenimonas cancrithermarum]